MVLGASASGATVYAEPAPAVALNNAEARLSAAEAAEEAAILKRLTRAVVSQLPRLRQASPWPFSKGVTSEALFVKVLGHNLHAMADGAESAAEAAILKRLMRAVVSKLPRLRQASCSPCDACVCTRGAGCEGSGLETCAVAKGMSVTGLPKGFHPRRRTCCSDLLTFGICLTCWKPFVGRLS